MHISVLSNCVKSLSNGIGCVPSYDVAIRQLVQLIYLQGQINDFEGGHSVTSLA